MEIVLHVHEFEKRGGLSFFSAMNQSSLLPLGKLPRMNCYLPATVVTGARPRAGGQVCGEQHSRDHEVGQRTGGYAARL